MPFEVERVITNRDGSYVGKDTVKVIERGQDIIPSGEIALEHLPPTSNISDFQIDKSSSNRIYANKFVLPNAKFVAYNDGLFGLSQPYIDTQHGECNRVVYYSVDEIPQVALGTFVLRRELKDPNSHFGDVIEYRLRYRRDTVPPPASQTSIVPVGSNDYII